MEPVGDPLYWRERLDKAKRLGSLHHAVFLCPEERWTRIEDKHREILAKVLKPDTSVLDCGCGYGRLLTLMPDWWRGAYLGVDVSPDFVQLAMETFPGREFLCADLLQGGDFGEWDLAVLISVRPMVKRNLGEKVWETMEGVVRGAAKRVLCLEYDAACSGFLE